MKKTLVALAALAVVSAASAQSTVTMYGLVDMSVTSNKDTSAGAAWGALAANSEATKNGIANGALSSSRLGFKGTEDLGGGLKANFVYELGITPDETTGFGSTRLGTVGLSGNFGAVTLGRQYTPYHAVQAAMDLYGNNNAPGYVVANHNRARSSNSVQYASPSFGGFTALALVGAGSSNGGTESAVVPGAQADGKDFGLAGVYAAGPLVAGVAYDEVTNAVTAASGFKTSTGTSTSYLLGGFTGKTVKTWVAGASYDFAVVKASLAYSSLTATAFDGAANLNDTTSKGYNISVAAPFGAVTVLANLGRANLVKEGAVDGTITGYQLGANYALSKRTTAYALIGREKAAFDLLPVAGDFTKRQTSVGVRHTF